MDSCYSLPFLLKCYERLGGAMCANPRDAAARRRRGVLARAAYAMRKERCAGSPRLPLARAGSIGKVRTPSPALSDASPGASAGCPDSEPKRKRRRPRRRARPALSARCALPPRGVLDAAELGAALDFYDDFTDGGIISARLAVLRRRWSDSRREQQAYSAARCLELMPKERAETEPAVWPVWAAIVNNLATALFADISPDFAQVSLCATRTGVGPFLALPLRGYLGWRRRARLAGLA